MPKNGSLGSGLRFMILCILLSSFIIKQELTMARSLRLEYTDALYHVGARRNHQEDIFVEACLSEV